jgi:hypothetical protein
MLERNMYFIAYLAGMILLLCLVVGFTWLAVVEGEAKQIKIFQSLNCEEMRNMLINDKGRSNAFENVYLSKCT